MAISKYLILMGC